MDFTSLTDVLKWAISKEESAFELYSLFRKKVKNPAAKNLLADLAAQELGHKRMLTEALANRNVSRIAGKGPVGDLHLSDYMVVETVTADSDPQQVMLFAMKREQEAYDGYRALLDHFAGTELEELFSTLAGEELRHKATLEREYQAHFAQWF